MSFLSVTVTGLDPNRYVSKARAQVTKDAELDIAKAIFQNMLDEGDSCAHIQQNLRNAITHANAQCSNEMGRQEPPFFELVDSSGDSLLDTYDPSTGSGTFGSHQYRASCFRRKNEGILEVCALIHKKLLKESEHAYQNAFPGEVKCCLALDSEPTLNSQDSLAPSPSPELSPSPSVTPGSNICETRTMPTGAEMQKYCEHCPGGAFYGECY